MMTMKVTRARTTMTVTRMTVKYDAVNDDDAGVDDAMKLVRAARPIKCARGSPDRVV